MRSRKDLHHLSPQLLDLLPKPQKLFSGSLIKRDRMKFSLAHAPPARQSCVDHKPGTNSRQIRAWTFSGSDEILLHLREDIRQVGERADQMGSAARWRAFSK